jgi:Flp pilus assembly protein CpaB
MKTENQTQLSPRMRQLLSTRRGIITVAAIAAVLGGAILVLFLSAYRDSLTGSDGTKKVLVARALIERGSPSDAIASDNMYEVTSVDKADIDDGALTDPDSLKGKITSATIYPGEQITNGDFRGQTDSLGDQIRGRERAISLPFTKYGGLVGDLKAGDHVDILGLFRIDPEGSGRDRPVARILMQDALVLKAPSGDEVSGATGSQKQAIAVRGTDEEATELAFTGEFGILWLALRPKAGAKEISRPSPIAVNNVVFGLPPLPVSEFRRQLGGRR